MRWITPGLGTATRTSSLFQMNPPPPQRGEGGGEGHPAAPTTCQQPRTYVHACTRARVHACGVAALGWKWNLSCIKMSPPPTPPCVKVVFVGAPAGWSCRGAAGSFATLATFLTRSVQPHHRRLTPPDPCETSAVRVHLRSGLPARGPARRKARRQPPARRSRS